MAEESESEEEEMTEESEEEEDIAETITLYHYTTKEGMKGIRESGVIYESTKSGPRDDARFGDGVYLTSLPPTDGKIRLALNNWDGSVKFAKKLINWGRVDCYVEVELDVDDVEQVDDERDIFMYPGDLLLDEAVDFTFGDVVKK